jgi:hypothetical protein
MSEDFIIYFVVDGGIADQFNYTDLTKYSEKKGKRLTLECPCGVFQYEGDKADIEEFYHLLEESKTKSRMSRPIITGPPPFIGIDVNSSGPTRSAVQAPSPEVVKPHVPASPASEMKIASALYDYEGQHDEEISIKEDDNLMILDESDPEWTLVKLVSKRGGTGLVPATYIEVFL